MKKLFMAIFFLVIIAVLLFQDLGIMASKADEKIAGLIEKYQDAIKEHDVFEDLNSKKYFDGKTFLLDKYAKDLGYIEIRFPREEETALILRRGEKKITIKKNGIVNLSIPNDQFEGGIDLEILEDDSDYSISYDGRILFEQGTSLEKIFAIANSMIHIRDSRTLMEMALKNRKDDERLIQNPALLKSFS